MSEQDAIIPGRVDVGVRAGARGRFYLAMSSILLLIVFIGFTPTLYFRGYFNAAPMPAYVILHGVVLTSWFVWFTAQAVFVAVGRADVHRRMGVGGVVIAVAVVAASVMVALGLVPRVSALGRDIDANLARYSGVVWSNLSTLVAFSTFFCAGILFRRRAHIHRRLMMLASISLVGPALGRIGLMESLQVFGSPANNEAVFGLIGIVTLLLAVVLYDVMTERRVHLVNLLGVPGFFVSVVFFAFYVANTDFGRAVVRSLE